MKSIAIVYHSTFKNTEAQAQAVLRGIERVEGVKVRLIGVENIEDQDWQYLDDAEGVVMGAPTYLGSLSSKFKSFMEKTGGIWAEQKWSDKLATGFSCSDCASGDKLQVLTQLWLFAAQHGMNWVSLGLMPGNIDMPEDEGNLNRLGSWVGAMAQRDKKADTVYPCDLKTAEHLGTRFANQVLRTQWDKVPAAETA